MLPKLNWTEKLNKKNHIGSSEGAALVEFALVLPLLLIFICGIIDFGNLYFNVHTVNEAARAGARYGSVYQNGSVDHTLSSLPSAVTTYVRQNYGNNFTVTVTPVPLLSKGNIKVDVSTSVSIITPLINQFFRQNPYVATGTCVMQLEN